MGISYSVNPRRTRILYLLVLTIIAVPTFIHIVTNGGFFPIHDDQSVARLYLLDQGIKQGVWYPRWVGMLGFGFGYPLFNFYPPLVYYIAEVFHLLGVSYIGSIKLTMVTGFALSTIAMFYLARKYLSRSSSLLASVLYTYFTYHAVVAYVRGALAEFFTFAVLPLVFLTLTNTSTHPNRKNAILFAVSLAALILTHPLIAAPSLFFIGFFTLFLLFRSKEKMQSLNTIFMGGLLGLLLPAFFWFPSLMEKQFTMTNSILTQELASYKIHYLYPMQFYFSQWGYGGSIEGPFDGMSFQLGKIHILLSIVSIATFFVYVFKTKKLDERASNFLFLLALLVFSLFMTTSYSSFVWDNLHFLWFLQFPWRFLTFTGVFIAVVASYNLDFFRGLVNRKLSSFLFLPLAVIISIVTIGTYQKYFKPTSFIQVTDIQKTSQEEISWRVSRSSFEFIPSGVVTKKSQFKTTIPAIDHKDIPKSPFIQSQDIKVQVIKDNFNSKEFVVNSAKETTFGLNSFNFPGWSAYVNGQKVSIDDKNLYKLITIQIPRGESKLAFIFKDTPVRKIANSISLISFAVVLIILSKESANKRST